MSRPFKNAPRASGTFIIFAIIAFCFFAVALILNKCQGTDGIRSTQTNIKTGSLSKSTN